MSYTIHYRLILTVRMEFIKLLLSPRLLVTLAGMSSSPISNCPPISLPLADTADTLAGVTGGVDVLVYAILLSFSFLTVSTDTDGDLCKSQKACEVVLVLVVDEEEGSLWLLLLLEASFSEDMSAFVFVAVTSPTGLLVLPQKVV